MFFWHIYISFQSHIYSAHRKVFGGIYVSKTFRRIHHCIKSLRLNPILVCEHKFAKQRMSSTGSGWLELSNKNERWPCWYTYIEWIIGFGAKSRYPRQGKAIASHSILPKSSICHYNDVIMGAIASQITSLTIVYSKVYSDADQRKHESSASLAFVQGIHRRGPVNSPHKWPVTRKMFPFDDVIMWRYIVFRYWLFWAKSKPFWCITLFTCTN